MYEPIISFLKQLFRKSGPRGEKPEYREIKESETDKKIIAIDGGDGVIIDGGPWIVSKIRLVYVVYKEYKLIEKDFLNCLLLVSYSNEGIEIKTSSDKDWGDIFPKKEDVEKLNIPVDKILTIPRIVREFSELKLARKMAGSGDIVIIDQLLYSESCPDIIKKAQQETIKENIVGIAKTCRLRTRRGRSLIGYLIENAKENTKWFYKVGERGKIIDLIVQYHKNSKNVFRTQMAKNADVEKILGILSSYSKDPMLLGYPYPLIKADFVARIPDYERRSERIKFEIERLESLNYEITSRDFHEELDRRAYR